MKIIMNLSCSFITEHRKMFFAMRNTLFIILICAFQSIAGISYAQSTRLSLDMKNSTVKEVLQKIEQQSEFYFLYNSELIDVQRKVDVSVTNEKIDDILTKLFNSDKVNILVRERHIILTPSNENTTQEGKKISGKVTDSSGATLPGASVVVKGTTTGVITDTNGNYSISVIPENATLQFSFVGMKNLEIPVGNKTTINITLAEESVGIEEVVAVGYGTQKRREVTGAMSQIKTKELADIPVANIGQKLQGKFAGVQINNNSGTPGSEMSFRIRGAASINAGNNPLIVIDGFPSESGLQSLSPDEIESISVLKDASASSLYGSRAANGVILVTTKQAKEGQKSVTFSAYQGIESVPDRGKPDLMNGQEFAQYKKEYYEDAAKYEGYTGGVPAIYQNPSQYAGKSGTNWFDVLLRNAQTQNYNIAFSSGTKELKSIVNLNYNKQEGVVLNSFDERFSVRANNIYTPNDVLTFGANLGITFGNNQVVPYLDNGRSFIELAYLLDPTLSYKNADGTYPVSFSQPGMFANPNYYTVVTQVTNKTKATRIIANTYAEVKIIDGLKLKTSLNVNTDNTINRQFWPSITQGWLGSAPPQPASGSYQTSNFLTWLSENTLTYKKTFGGMHNIDALAGYTVQKYAFESSNIDGSQFPDDNIPWINAATTRIGNVGARQWSLLSYIGRLNYDYNNKYLVSLAFRRDGSSKFGPNNKYGNFPSVSLGWIASDEQFIKNIKPINFLKIRGSFGKVGNNNIGEYTYLASVSTKNYVFGNQVTPGSNLNNIQNNNLTWESTTSYDLGLDLGLFNNRISFTYDYYWKKTDGLLYQVPIPQQSGFSNIWTNVGRFDFWGHEFAVETRNLTGKLKWNTNFNISFDRNIVKKLGLNDAPIGGYDEAWDDNRTAVGHPIGMFYGYINTGVYMTQHELDTQPHDATAMVGTARFKDVSGPDGVPDGKIDSNDRTWIGNPNPKFVYGLTNSFTYQDLDLSIVMAGTVGNDISDDAFQSTENLDGVFNVRKGVANRWRSEENPGLGEYPRTRSGTTADFRNFTTRQVFKGTYLAVKNITLGYTLPVRKIKAIKNLRIYVSAQNAIILTKYPGMNPEAGMNGLNGLNQGRDFTGYPIPRVFAGGLSVSF